MNILCWLWPLLAGLICGILGYLLGKYLASKWRAKYKSIQEDLNTCKDEKSKLETKLKKAEKELSECSKKDGIIAGLEAKLASAFLIPFNASAAKNAFGRSVKQDDLKIVEGIGTKIEELFHNAGIKTWKQLSETSIDKCQEVLNNGGDRFKMHKPNTWPEQAKMAYEGKWAELVKWQGELNGGK